MERIFFTPNWQKSVNIFYCCFYTCNKAFRFLQIITSETPNKGAVQNIRVLACLLLFCLLNNNTH